MKLSLVGAPKPILPRTLTTLLLTISASITMTSAKAGWTFEKDVDEFNGNQFYRIYADRTKGPDYEFGFECVKSPGRDTIYHFYLDFGNDRKMTSSTYTTPVHYRVNNRPLQMDPWAYDGGPLYDSLEGASTLVLIVNYQLTELENIYYDVSDMQASVSNLQPCFD